MRTSISFLVRDMFLRIAYDAKNDPILTTLFPNAISALDSNPATAKDKMITKEKIALTLRAVALRVTGMKAYDFVSSLKTLDRVGLMSVKKAVYSVIKDPKMSGKSWISAYNGLFDDLGKGTLKDKYDIHDFIGSSKEYLEDAARKFDTDKIDAAKESLGLAHLYYRASEPMIVRYQLTPVPTTKEAFTMPWAVQKKEVAILDGRHIGNGAIVAKSAEIGDNSEILKTIDEMLKKGVTTGEYEGWGVDDFGALVRELKRV
jgi:hypothetical protein